MDISKQLRYEATGENGVLPPPRYIPLMLSAANEIDDLNHQLQKSDSEYVDNALRALQQLDEETRNADRLADALHLLAGAKGVPAHLVDIVFDAIENYDNLRQIRPISDT